MYIKHKRNKTIRNRTHYKWIAEVKLWERKFREMMQNEMFASIAVVRYYLACNTLTSIYPSECEKYRYYGMVIAVNTAAFAAAENTGLLAEGITGIFHTALDNYGNWLDHETDIKNIMKKDKLRKYVSFTDRRYAEMFLSCDKMERYNEDLWEYLKDVTKKKLATRSAKRVLRLMKCCI